MRVLAVDPGAEKGGWCCLEAGDVEPLYVQSGLERFPRSDRDFQVYRGLLIERWVYWCKTLMYDLDPDVVVTETVPAVGGGNFVVAAQSYLAHAQITVIHSLANLYGYPVVQVGATTVKARIGLSKKASKVQVRNGVYDLMPWSEQNMKDSWKEMFRNREYDECDAFAIALTHLGYDRRPNGSKQR
jgi:Holliday junction resolvasome RuvABC endonuclease subunit